MKRSHIPVPAGCLIKLKIIETTGERPSGCYSNNPDRRTVEGYDSSRFRCEEDQA